MNKIRNLIPNTMDPINFPSEIHFNAVSGRNIKRVSAERILRVIENLNRSISKLQQFNDERTLKEIINQSKTNQHE